MVLVKHQYDPYVHMTSREDGLIIPTEECPQELLNDILTYFKQRNEDEFRCLLKSSLIQMISTKTRAKTAKVAYDLSEYSLIVFLIGAALALTICSIIVHDVTFAKKHPVKFTIETLLMAFVATFPYMFLIWSRTGTLGVKNLSEYAVLILKFSGLHLFLQFSGVYSLTFKASGTPVLLS